MKIITYSFLLLLSSNSIGQDKDWLTVGIVRGDGIIIPTFRYEDNNWKYVCGQMDEFRFYESTLRKWYFVPFSGEPYYLNASSLVIYNPEDDYDDDYSKGYGYLSDYQCQNLTEKMHPFSNVGICLSDAYPVLLFNSIEDSSSVYQEIFNLISKRFIEVDTNSTLDETLDKYFGENHIVNFTRFRISGTKVDSIYVYYFETSFTFVEDGCPRFVFYNGWIFKYDNKYKIMNDRLGIDDCDFKMFSNATPLFVIEIDDKPTLHYIHHSWGEVSFVIWEISPEEMKKWELY